MTFNSDATYKIQLNSTSAKADKVVVAGVLINGGAQFKFSDVGSATNFPSVLADETGNADADDG